MLVELRVRNLGVLSDASVTFAPGLNVLTGETGAGKTLLVTSLALLAGARGDARLVQAGNKEAVVEAVVAPPPALRALLEARGIESDDAEVTIARRIGADGRSRAWLSGHLVPVSALAEAGRALLELLGQGEAFALARPAAQLEALDAFAGATPARREWAEALSRLRAIRRELDDLHEMERERARTVDTLAHQADEIERAKLEPGEDAEIALDLARLEHADRLSALGASALESCAADGFAEAAKRLAEASRIDASIAPVASRVAAIAAEAEDVAREIRAWSEGIEADPTRLSSLHERASAIARLKRKYGETVEDVLAYGAACRARLIDLERADERAEALAASLPVLEASLDETGARLSALRTDGARALEQLVRDELPSLALPGAAFEVAVEPSGQDAEHGRDRVEFRFAARAGAPAAPLGVASSGGELSRVMIAVACGLAGAHSVPVIVLDEAEQGVGGEAALDLARRMRVLGRSHQVLVVTHLPQIAAFADHHLVVERARGVVSVVHADGDARVAEVSRMLSGLGASERGRAHAAELLELGAAHDKPRRRAARARAGVG